MKEWELKELADFSPKAKESLKKLSCDILELNKIIKKYERTKADTP